MPQGDGFDPDAGTKQSASLRCLGSFAFSTAACDIQPNKYAGGSPGPGRDPEPSDWLNGQSHVFRHVPTAVRAVPSQCVPFLPAERVRT